MIELAELYRQYQGIRGEIDAAIAGVIAGSAYIGGAEVSAFEQEFAAYTGARYCIAVGNCTDALEITLSALRIHNSRVIVPAMTAAPTVEAIVRTANRPIFCDVGQDYTLDPADVERRITPDTAAILPVHLYGAPADLDALHNIALHYGLVIVEDCAQAHGTRYNGAHVGTAYEAGCFSFYPSKNLGAFGDAGAIVTNDPQLADRCRKLHNHGRSSKFAHELVGRNSRMDGLQAAVLRVKLRHLDGWLAARRANAAAYDAAFAGLLALPAWDNPQHTYTYHQYPLLVKGRAKYQRRLTEAGVATGVHYPFALPRLPCYARFADGAYPVAERLAAEELSLPVHELLSVEDVAAVIAAVKAVVE